MLKVLGSVNKIQGKCLSRFEVGILLIFTSFYALLNSKNLLGPHSLFMDEKLIFDGVIKILNPESFSTFSYAIIDGGDQRYGRLLWNLIALFSFIPYKIWGSEGIIFTERLFGGVIIILALIILSRIYAKTKLVSLVAILIICSLPFSTYYATTPKPEPLMLLFCALYLFKSANSKSAFGVQWVYVGLMVGMKISGLFVFAALAILSITQTRLKKISIDRIDLLKSIAYLGIGFSIAVPTLYVFALLGFMIILINKASPKVFERSFMYLLVTFFTIWVVSLSWQSFRNYYSWTIGSSRHGTDSSSINYESWLNYIFEIYFQSEAILLCLLLLVILMVTFNWKSDQSQNLFGIFVPLCIAAASTIPILFFVERLWGFYLWFGSVFFIYTLLIYVNQARLTLKWIFPSLVGVTMVLLIYKINPVNFPITEVKSALALEKKSEFRLQKFRYEKIIDILGAENSSNGVPKTVAYDPLLWIPESTKLYQIKPFWGPYVDWENPVDILIFTDEHTKNKSSLGDRNSSARDVEIKGFATYVDNGNSNCRQNHCYFVSHNFEGVVVLKLR